MTTVKPRTHLAPHFWPFPSRTETTQATSAAGVSGRRWARRYQARLFVTDALVVVITTFAAQFVRFGFDSITIPDAFGIDYLVLSLAIALVWLGALSSYHTRDARVVGMGVSEYKRVVSASLTTWGVLAITFLIAKIDVARGYFVLTLPLGMLGLLLGRWIWRKWLVRQRVADHYLSRAIVVGDPEDVDYVVTQIRANSGAAYSVVGAAIDGHGTARPQTTASSAVPVVTDLDGISRAATGLDVDTVIVAGRPAGKTDFVRQLAWQLEGTATDLVLASRLTDVAGPRIHFRPVEGLPLIHVEIPQFEGGRHVLKRAFDVTASGIAMILLSPLFLLLAIGVRMDSSGPALFHQERVGRNGETFRMHKFRSMSVSAELDRAALLASNEGSGLLFKIREDPRVTRFGRFLRKHSLDELPQLWNIFVGDMSLVGPRPPLQTEVDAYERHVHRRLYIKPGLTGLWQVNGRSDLSWEESVRLDLYYVENWSLTGDFVILWRTVRVMLDSTGAY